MSTNDLPQIKIAVVGYGSQGGTDKGSGHGGVSWRGGKRSMVAVEACRAHPTMVMHGAIHDSLIRAETGLQNLN